MANNEFKDEAQKLVEESLRKYEAALADGSDADIKLTYQSLLKNIEKAKQFGFEAVLDFQKINSPKDIIDQLRLQLDQRRMTSKIQDARCKCGKGKMGRIGKRDANSGLMDVKLRRGGNIKCHDIGIGQAAEGTEVIAFVPPKTQTGFVDYKK